MNPSSATTATVNAEPTPGQCQRYIDDEDKDDEALDKIPGNADDPHGFK